MHRILYVQVLAAIALGIAVGFVFPAAGIALKPLGDGFIELIKMMIAPVIFCTVVHGIASMGDLKKFGRIGLQGPHLFRGGVHLGAGDRPGRRRDREARARLQHRSGDAGSEGGRRLCHPRPGQGIVGHLLAIIPDSFFGAFAGGDLLQVLLVAILTGFAITRMGELGERIGAAIENAGSLLPHHRHGRAAGADRRLRRHGLHHRRLRRRRAVNLGALIVTFY